MDWTNFNPIARCFVGQAGQAKLISSLIVSVSTFGPKLFNDSGEVLMMSHAHSGFDFDSFGLDEGVKFHDFPFFSANAEGFRPRSHQPVGLNRTGRSSEELANEICRMKTN